jgi:hypothetical protein
MRPSPVLVSFLVCPRQILWVQGLAIVGLIVLHVISQWFCVVGGHCWVFGLTDKLDLNSENSLGAILSALFLLLNSGLLAVIAHHSGLPDQRLQRDFALLSGCFAFLALDEAVGIHELCMWPVRSTFHLSGWLYYSWVLPYAGITVLLAFYFLRLLWRLPPRTSWGLVASGVIYVTGAMGIECWSAAVAREVSEHSLAYVAVSTLEESFEMLGVYWLTRVLLQYLSQLAAQGGSTD